MYGTEISVWAGLRGHGAGNGVNLSGGGYIASGSNYYRIIWLKSECGKVSAIWLRDFAAIAE